MLAQVREQLDAIQYGKDLTENEHILVRYVEELLCLTCVLTEQISGYRQMLIKKRPTAANIETKEVANIEAEIDIEEIKRYIAKFQSYLTRIEYEREQTTIQQEEAVRALKLENETQAALLAKYNAMFSDRTPSRTPIRTPIRTPLRTPTKTPGNIDPTPKSNITPGQTFEPERRTPSQKSPPRSPKSQSKPKPTFIIQPLSPKSSGAEDNQ